MLKTSLRYFNAVVQHGSIRAAADHLNVAQSAISRQLQAIEHDLGTAVFERRARGVALTHAGDILFRFVREATFNVERVRSEIDALQGLRRGHVRLAVIESLVSQVVPQAIARFRDKHGGVTFQVLSLGTDRVVEAVRAADVEIGMAFNQPRRPDLKVVFGMKEPVYAMMAPDHPLARRRTLSLGQIAGWPVGLAMSRSGSRQLVDAATARAGVQMNIALETNSIELLHKFALGGQGISFLARLNCMDSIRSGRLVAVRLTDAALGSGSIDVVTLAARRLPLAAEEFLIHLRHELQNQPAHGRRRALESDAVSASPR